MTVSQNSSQKPSLGSETSCPLCAGLEHLLVNNQFRPGVAYLLCQTCDLIFLPKQFHLSAEAEKKRYENHQNSSADSGYDGYVQFLRPMIEAVQSHFRQRLSEAEAEGEAKIKGLDYGCGPTPALAELLNKAGFLVAGYDPYFAANQKVMSDKYSFVVSTEVFEHFYSPLRELKTIYSLLMNQGSLFVLTQLHQGPKEFFKWWYPKDLTHVCFYSEKSFQWISTNLGFLMVVLDSKSLIKLVKN